VARRKGTTAVAEVAKVIDRTWIEREAEDRGIVQRERKFDLVTFVASLVLGFRAAGERRLASLLRSYNLAVSKGKEMAWGAWRPWFTRGIAALMKDLALRGLERLNLGSPEFVGTLSKFRDIIAIDSVVIRLNDALQELYPACRTNHTQAAAKMHTALSVTGRSDTQVTVTSERVNDRTPFRRIGQWVRGNLLLFDLGYYSHWLFSRINNQGGWFVSRLKENANPFIVGLNRAWRGNSVSLVGERLRDVEQRLTREEVDVTVEVEVSRRKYRGRSSHVMEQFRVVGVRNEAEGCYHWYITNVPIGILTAVEIAMVYSARWLVELLFRELATYHRIKDMPTADPVVVETLIYASLTSLVISRRLAVYLTRRIVDRKARIATERLAAAISETSHLILLYIARPASRKGLPATWITEALWRHAVSPHRNRPDLAMRVDMGTQLSYLQVAQRAA